MTAIDLAELLKPVALPRIVDHEYRQDEFERIVDVIRTHERGPGSSRIRSNPSTR